MQSSGGGNVATNEHVLSIEELQLDMAKTTRTDQHRRLPLVKRSSVVSQRFVDVTIQLRPGECVALMGRSGVGKSSLLRVVAGFTELAPNSNSRVSIAGHVVDEPRRRIYRAPWKRNIGYAFQGGAGLQMDRDVRSNISFPLREGGRGWRS